MSGDPDLAPLRASVNPDHIFHEPDKVALYRKLEVRLNGVKQEHVVTYNREAGWLECHLIDSNGNIMHKDGILASVRKFGVISVSVKP